MGYRIKEIRKSKNMTQKNLAQKAGVSRTIISFLESGAKEQTTLKTMKKIANALEVDVKDILL